MNCFIFPFLGAFPAPLPGFDFTCLADCGKGNARQGNPYKSYGMPKNLFLWKAVVRFERISLKTVLDGMAEQ